MKTSSSGNRDRVKRVCVWLVTAPFRAIWLALIVVAPLFASWVASSLAAHRGTSIRLAAASALLVFPVLPLLWEGFAEWRHRRTGSKKPRFLTLSDRLVLRTLLVSTVFVAALLYHRPQQVFESLNARGDWMLDGQNGPFAQRARPIVFAAASRLRWLYQWIQARSARQRADAAHRQGRAQATPAPRPLETNLTLNRPAPAGQPQPLASATAATTTPPPADPHQWPWAAQLHPVITSMPASVETSPQAVGAYIADHEPDAWQRAKAVHDYVADRVAYDVDAYFSHRIPAQDADVVFRTRLSVCAGYSALYYAIASAAGLTVEVIVGTAKGFHEEGMGEGHAWNAIRLDRKWYLIDSTWDAGYVEGTRFVKRYSTSYFLSPPELFFSRHFPNNNNWQLLNPVRSDGDFLRAPPLWPAFFQYNLRLIDPTRAETDAHGSIVIQLENPSQVFVIATVSGPNGEASRDCEVQFGPRTEARCTLQSLGLHKVTMFASAVPFGQFEAIGSLRVHSR